MMLVMITRREFIGTGLGAVGATLVGGTLVPWVTFADGFTPFAEAGKVVQVRHPSPLEGIGMKPAAAREMLAAGVKALTGARSAEDAWRRFVRPTDVVALKPNGLGGRFLATHKELLEATIDALVGVGVPPTNILIYEQYNPYMRACRFEPNTTLPNGVRVKVHLGRDAGPEWTRVPSGRTKFVRPLLEATAVISFPLAKDHAICGVTGCLKNMSHGSITNPSDFHRRHASPMIAELYAHEAIRTRVRLHVLDATRVLCNNGPQDAPNFRRNSDALWFSTDPVAIDTLLVDLIEADRRARRLPALAARGTPPSYIAAAAGLGLGIGETSRIRTQEIRVG